MTEQRKKLNYFKEMYELYQDSEMTLREFKKHLYEDLKIQKELAIGDTMIDNFWESLMDGVYNPDSKNVKPQAYKLL